MHKAILFFLIAVHASPALAQGNFTGEQLERMAIAFIDAKDSRQQPDSDADDIERFLALLADEFVDEHVRFEVTVTDKNELRAGMLRKLEDEVIYSRIEIDQIMTGRNVVFVKYVERAKVRPFHSGNVIEYSSTNIVSLEFNEQGLIKHMQTSWLTARLSPSRAVRYTPDLRPFSSNGVAAELRFCRCDFLLPFSFRLDSLWRL